LVSNNQFKIILLQTQCVTPVFFSKAGETLFRLIAAQDLIGPVVVQDFVGLIVAQNFVNRGGRQQGINPLLAQVHDMTA